MKTLQMNFALLTLFFFGIQCMTAGNRMVNCLDVTIAPTFHKTILENCVVELMHENQRVQKINKPNRGNKFRFSLKSNSHYTILINCEGFHPRKISFDTSIPDSVSLAMIFQFCAKVEMIPVSVSLDAELDDFPIALVSYDNKQDLFLAREKYTVLVKKTLFEKKSTPGKEIIVIK